MAISYGADLGLFPDDTEYQASFPAEQVYCTGPSLPTYIRPPATKKIAQGVEPFNNFTVQLWNFYINMLTKFLNQYYKVAVWLAHILKWNLEDCRDAINSEVNQGWSQKVSKAMSDIDNKITALQNKLIAQIDNTQAAMLREYNAEVTDVASKKTAQANKQTQYRNALNKWMTDHETITNWITSKKTPFDKALKDYYDSSNAKINPAYTPYAAKFTAKEKEIKDAKAKAVTDAKTEYNKVKPDYDPLIKTEKDNFETWFTTFLAGIKPIAKDPVQPAAPTAGFVECSIVEIHDLPEDDDTSNLEIKVVFTNADNDNSPDIGIHSIATLGSLTVNQYGYAQIFIVNKVPNSTAHITAGQASVTFSAQYANNTFKYSTCSKNLTNKDVTTELKIRGNNAVSDAVISNTFEASEASTKALKTDSLTVVNTAFSNVSVHWTTP